ncbi:MAG: hypothetical protein OEX14_07790, partial [Paracoccaceae bacterium]|nr:hypothetical protein [Paracoccaceae bacterium]
RPVWTIDAKGVGRAVYRAIGPERTYSLVAFAHDLPAEMRSDRVIATAWDATFTLFDGTPSDADLDRLQANVPLQEAGRISPKELSLSRANRSVRLFEHVVGRLAEGRQPDTEELDAVGYLMRTTAVYGSGKFGAADRSVLQNRAEARGPFQIEMLSVWLTRAFTVDLVEHLAAGRGGKAAVKMAPELRLRIGVGNSTGLGMAPFLIRHPVLLNNWMMAREEALCRVRSQKSALPEAIAGLHVALANAQRTYETWRSTHPIQVRKLEELGRDLQAIRSCLEAWPGQEAYPWDMLWRWGESSLSLEGQEMLLSLILEPHGELVDGLADCMDADEGASFHIDGSMPLGQVRRVLQKEYDWALAVDYDDPDAIARFWYVSEEKLEPRLGERFSETGGSLEMPLCIGRLAAEMARDVSEWQGEDTLAAFLLAHPEHRFMARRLQVIIRHPFAEVRDNLIAANMLPIDLLRCKLAFFGASHFDPRSDRWVRICLFQYAPYPQDLMAGESS